MYLDKIVEYKGIFEDFGIGFGGVIIWNGSFFKIIFGLIGFRISFNYIYESVWK